MEQTKGGNSFFIVFISGPVGEYNPPTVHHLVTVNSSKKSFCEVTKLSINKSEIQTRQIK